MATANDLCHTVAKHSFPCSFNSGKDQEFNDEDITESDISKIGLSVGLYNVINFEAPEEDLERIDVNVAVVEATRFRGTNKDLTCIDQSTWLLQVTNIPDTEEHKAKMAMIVELADDPSIDCCEDKEEELTY